MNHYEALEVSPNASPEVLRAAYKSLIQRYHPDRNPGDETAAARSLLVVQAYQVLSDAGQRAAYDAKLKRQAPHREPAAVAARGVPRASEARRPRGPHWLLWPFTGLLVLALWLFWSAFDTPPTTAQATATGSQPVTSQTGLRGQSADAAARTIPTYLENIEVELVLPADPAAPTAPASRSRLSIRTLGVVVGDFDPEKFLAFLDQNQDYIGRQLQEKLRRADVAMLSRGSGDHYLQQYLLDALGEITNTDRREKYSLPGSEAAAHYGAVEILLPDSYTIEPQATGPRLVNN